MPEWWTYAPGDFLMYSPRVYARLLAAYQRDLWPAQAGALALAVAVAALVRSRVAWRGRAVSAILAAGWAFAGYRFKGRDQLFLLLLATMFVPPIATLVPLYWVVQTAGLLDSIVGVLVPQLANAFGIYLIRQSARGGRHRTALEGRTRAHRHRGSARG